MLLTIAIPTTPDRHNEFTALCKSLTAQINGNTDIEIIYELDNKEISIGAKRQKLIDRAKGEYIFQCDSDDNVAPDYIEKVLEALQSKPDCVCYFEYIMYNNIPKVSCHSNDFADWGENYREGNNFYHYIRTPFFKDVIKTDICRAIPVQHIRYAEDVLWSRDLKKSGLIKTEVFINDFMYYYSYTNQTESQMRERYGIK